MLCRILIPAFCYKRAVVVGVYDDDKYWLDVVLTSRNLASLAATGGR
jgi:hypothetical protein